MSTDQRWLYKIWSGHDGFTPSELPARMTRRTLTLGWKHWIDEVDPGEHVWIYFHGPHVDPAGVYARGRVTNISGNDVRVHVEDYSATAPLTTPAKGRALAEIVGARGRQVFVLPPRIRASLGECDLETSAESCAGRGCRSCPRWQAIPVIRPKDFAYPDRLTGVDTFVPAYWTIAPRTELAKAKNRFDWLAVTTSVLKRLKTDERNVAFFFAAGIVRALERSNIDCDFDAVIPVPLSPEKRRRGRPHRVRWIAGSVGGLLDVPTRDWLKLEHRASKRGSGLTAAQFEAKYDAALRVSAAMRKSTRVLVVDDVTTRGSTLSTIVSAIAKVAPDVEVVTASGALFATKGVVVDPKRLSVPKRPRRT